MPASGLEGVIAATTQLSHVDGERGELVIGGYQLEQLAEYATFEETTWLLWQGELPSVQQLEEFRHTLAERRAIPGPTLSLLRECAQRQIDDMDALRMAAGTLSLVGDEAVGIVARVPTIVASYWRLRRGEEPLSPRSELDHAANFLYMLTGELPDPERVRGLETYLNTVIDHGLNASRSPPASSRPRDRISCPRSPVGSERSKARFTAVRRARRSKWSSKSEMPRAQNRCCAQRSKPAKS